MSQKDITLNDVLVVSGFGNYLVSFQDKSDRLRCMLQAHLTCAVNQISLFLNFRPMPHAGVS